MFMGAGTTALVALKMNRRFIGIEPKKEYVDMAYKRIDKYLYQSKLF
jgi:DNA modification methylase